MARYVDIDKLITEACKDKNTRLFAQTEDIASCKITIDVVYDELGRFADTHYQRLKNPDVVEVVRCKDCINSRPLAKYEQQIYNDDCVGCTRLSTSYHSVIMCGNDFCNYGERKEA